MNDPNSLNSESVEAALKSSRFDPNSTPQQDVTVLTIQDRVIGTLGSYVAVTGKPKAGKTLFLSAMLASAYAPYDIWGCKITLPPDRNRIAYFDTEQTPYSFHRLMNRVKANLGMDNAPAYIQAYLLRRFEPYWMIAMIEAVLDDKAISCVFIDGFLDLANNFNDEREAKSIVRFLKRITEERNILVIGVIHQSKRDSFSLGHLGSEIDRFADSTVSIEKDATKKFITMSAGLLRHSIDEFSPITIMHDGKDFVPTSIDITAKQTKSNEKGPYDYTEIEHRYILSGAIPSIGCDYDYLVRDISESKGLSKIKAKAFVKYWREQSYIVKGQDGLYRQPNSGGLFAVKEGG